MNLDLIRERALVGGEWITSGSGAVLEVFDPSTGRRLGAVPDLGAVETTRAVTAAAAALPAWRTRPANERSTIMRRWAEGMRARADDLAGLITAEQGKPTAEALAEVAYAASFLEWFAEEAKRLYGDVIPAPSTDHRILTLKTPVGVVGAITPWNFPAAMITRKAGAALAAGCTLVLKPSELTPFTALALALMGEAAGVPPGVLNVVTGRPEAIGEVLTGDPRVRKLSFTGSTRIGKMLAARCAQTVKRVSLELGGNAALIVFEDADLDGAVQGALQAKFRNAGQACVSANRILVEEGIHDAFVKRLVEAVWALRVGDGRLEVDVGPLINAAAVAKARALVDEACANGARVAGSPPPTPAGTTFFAPTVLAGVTQEMRIAREEVFGPVAPVMRFSTEAQAVRLANATEYGLAAYVFTRSLDRLFRVSEALDVGMVGFNTGSVSNVAGPFGGVKDSGYGREGSKYGLDDYVDIRQITIGLDPAP